MKHIVLPILFFLIVGSAFAQQTVTVPVNESVTLTLPPGTPGPAGADGAPGPVGPTGPAGPPGSSGSGSSAGNNIVSFGAKCDGVTDDLAAILAAWRALPQTGGLAIIPTGCNAFVSAPVVLDNTGLNSGQRNGPALYSYGQISADTSTANFVGKPVVHIEGIESAVVVGLHIHAPNSATNAPAAGLAVTPDSASHQANLIGRNLYIEGFYTAADLYNVSSENSHVDDSLFTNYACANVLYDSSNEVKSGLSISPIENLSNTRKEYSDDEFLGYCGAPQTLAYLQGAEYIFRKNHSFYASGKVFDETGAVQINSVQIDNWRNEMPSSPPNTNRFWYDGTGNTSGSTFSDIYQASNSGTAAVFECAAGNCFGLSTFDHIYTSANTGDAIRWSGTSQTIQGVTARRIQTLSFNTGAASNFFFNGSVESNANASPITGSGVLAPGFRVVGSTGTANYGPTSFNVAPTFGTALSALVGGTGSIVAPAPGQILVGNAGGTAYVPRTVGGSCTNDSNGVFNCTGGGGGGGGGTAIIGGSSNNGPVAGATQYAALTGGATGATALNGLCQTIPRSGTASNLTCNAGGPLGAAGTYTYTLYDMTTATPTTLTCAITGATQMQCLDTSDQPSVTGGDAYCMRIAATGALTARLNTCSFILN